MKELEESLPQYAEMETEEAEENRLQNLRSKATELLLREEYEESIKLYSQFLSQSQNHLSQKNPNSPNHIKLQKSICLAFSNRAEARFRLNDFSEALRDCTEALMIEKYHFKSLLCKGKILLNLNMYGNASIYFKFANSDPQAKENPDLINGFLDKSKKLLFLSRTGAFDVSDWVLGGFKGGMPELAEYIGEVEIKKSGISGRGLFATKNVESGSLLLVTKAIAVDRAILCQDSGENAQLVIWKNLIDKVVESVRKSNKINTLISKLSTGKNEDSLEVPGIGIFQPETDVSLSENLDMRRMVSILDLNSILERAISSKVLGKNADYQGIGLWVLASLINHSCDNNVRRVHIGDHVLIHASRDVKAGEELTIAYFDVLSPLAERVKMAKKWGFNCNCKRCEYEEKLLSDPKMSDIEAFFGEKVVDMGNAVYRLEECMKKLVVRGKGRGYLRASFWDAYSKVFGSDMLMRKWGRKIPSTEAVVDTVVDVVGSDERILKVFMERMKRCGNKGVVEMEKEMKLGRGIYGKIMKKHAMRKLLQF